MREGRQILSHHEIQNRVLSNPDLILQQIRIMKPHMYQLSKSLLHSAPVSFYAYFQSLHQNYHSTNYKGIQSYDTIIQEEEEEQKHCVNINAPDKTESFIGGTLLDTTHTNGQQIYTLDIFWKTTVIDLKAINHPILAFLIRGMDLIYKYNLELLNKLQEQFLQMNITSTLNSQNMEESQELSLFRQQPILPKRLLIDLVDRLEKCLALEVLEKHSVAKEVLEIWVISLLQDVRGSIPKGEKLFLRLGELFQFQTIKNRNGVSYTFIKEDEGFVITQGTKGYILELI